jgi:sterol desaturase/sphingolipid hydroxylase (fatty acid hydroxylase superfamily)
MKIPSAVYLLLYASGAYTLVLSPPIERAVSTLPVVTTTLPVAAKCAIAFVVTDLFAYWAHRAAHCVPWLWRIHRVHHEEQKLGPLTTFRFHVLEITWRMLFAAIPLRVLGVSPWSSPALFVFAPLLLQILAHSDFPWTFGTAGRLIVSPAYHSGHHDDGRSRFAMTFPFWDELFGTRAA